MSIHSMTGCACRYALRIKTPTVKVLVREEIERTGHTSKCINHPLHWDRSNRFTLHNRQSHKLNCRNCVGQGRHWKRRGDGFRCASCRGYGRVSRQTRDEQPWEPANRIYAHQSTSWRKWALLDDDTINEFDTPARWEARIKKLRREGDTTTADSWASVYLGRPTPLPEEDWPS